MLITPYFTNQQPASHYLIKQIKMISIENLRTKINTFHKAGTPFLFGIDYEMRNAFFVDNPLEQDYVLFRMDKVKNYDDSSITTTNPSNTNINLQIVDIEPYDSYSKRFNIIHNGLKQGDTFLANLTSRTRVKSTLTLREIFLLSKSRFGLYHPDAGFVSFSPEGFVSIDSQNNISSFPMKGTIDASIPNAQDIIINDYKELCEHRTIVDLIRNDLSIVSSNVKVERFRYIDTIYSHSRTLLQTSSEITGKLPDDYELGDTILKLLPAGSISGAPKPRTMELIRQAEGIDRGFYCGVFGYFDGREFCSAVAIRYIEQEAHNNEMYYRSGGGITINSDIRAEHQEIQSKIYIPI